MCQVPGAGPASAGAKIRALHVVGLHTESSLRAWSQNASKPTPG
jgi:hypothetical protein